MRGILIAGLVAIAAAVCGLLVPSEAEAARKQKQQTTVTTTTDQFGNTTTTVKQKNGGKKNRSKRLGSYDGHQDDGRVTLDGTPINAFRLDPVCDHGNNFGRGNFGSGYGSSFGSPRSLCGNSQLHGQQFGAPSEFPYDDRHADAFFDPRTGDLFERDRFGNVRFRGNAFRGSAVIANPGSFLRLNNASHGHGY